MSVGEALLCLEIGRTDASNFNVSLSHHALVTRACVFQSAWKSQQENEMRKHLRSGPGWTWVSVLALPFPRYVTLGKPLISSLTFITPQIRLKSVPTSWGYYKDSVEIMHVKYFSLFKRSIYNISIYNVHSPCIYRHRFKLRLCTGQPPRPYYQLSPP